MFASRLFTREGQSIPLVGFLVSGDGPKMVGCILFLAGSTFLEKKVLPVALGHSLLN